MPRFHVSCLKLEPHTQASVDKPKYEGFFYVVDLTGGHRYPRRLVSSAKDFRQLCRRLKDKGGQVVALPGVVDPTTDEWTDGVIYQALEEAGKVSPPATSR